MERHRIKVDSCVLTVVTLAVMCGDVLAAPVEIDLQRIPVANWDALLEEGLLSVQEIRDQLAFETLADPGFDGTPALASNDTLWMAPRSIPAERDLVLRGSHFAMTHETGIGLVVDPTEFYAPAPDPEAVLVVLDASSGVVKLLVGDLDSTTESQSVPLVLGENLRMAVRLTHLTGGAYSVSASWFGSESGVGSHAFAAPVILVNPAYVMYGGAAFVSVAPDDDGGATEFDLQRIPVANWDALLEEGLLSVQEIRDQLALETLADPGFDGTPALASNDTLWMAPRSIPTERDLVLRGAHYAANRETSIGLVVDPNEFYAPVPDPEAVLVVLDASSGVVKLLVGDLDSTTESQSVPLVLGENLRMAVRLTHLTGGAYSVAASWFGSESGAGSHEFATPVILVNPAYVMYGGAAFVSVTADDDGGAAEFDLQRIPVANWDALLEEGLLSVEEIRDQLAFEPLADPGFDGTPALVANDTLWMAPRSIPGERDLVLRGSHYAITPETSMGLIVDPNEFFAPSPDPEFVSVLLDALSGEVKLFAGDFDSSIESQSVPLVLGESLRMAVRLTHGTGNEYSVSASWFGSESGAGSHAFTAPVTLANPGFAMYGGAGLINVPEPAGLLSGLGAIAALVAVRRLTRCRTGRLPPGRAGEQCRLRSHPAGPRGSSP